VWDIAGSSVLVTEKYEDTTTATNNNNDHDDDDDDYDNGSNDVDHDTKQKY
jgi:hypothetical protein